jgi:hypothetical protein
MTNSVCHLNTMKTTAKNVSSHGLFFPNWSQALQADDSLTPGLRESYRRILTGFLDFCRQRQAVSSVALARDYVELLRLEQAPAPARLQTWKDGLNWFFREATAAASAGQGGQPAPKKIESRTPKTDRPQAPLPSPLPIAAQRGEGERIKQPITDRHNPTPNIEGWKPRDPPRRARARRMNGENRECLSWE